MKTAAEPTELCGFIPLRDVALKMGKPWNSATRKWLVRRMKKHDADPDASPCLFRAAGTGKRANWCTTWAAVRSAFPQWLPREKEAAALVAKSLECYDDKLLLLARKVDALAKSLAAHTRWHRDSSASARDALARARPHSTH